MFGPPIEIRVNGIPIKLWQPVNQAILSLEINLYAHQIPIRPNEKLAVAEWIWKLIERCSAEYITYQGVLIPKSEVKRYKGK